MVVGFGGRCGTIVAFLLAGLRGAVLVKISTEVPDAPLGMPGTRAEAGVCIVAFLALLFGLPGLSALFPGYALELFSGFFRVGSLVFGGGHVVLPLLQAGVGPPACGSADGFPGGCVGAQGHP